MGKNVRAFARAEKINRPCLGMYYKIYFPETERMREAAVEKFTVRIEHDIIAVPRKICKRKFHDSTNTRPRASYREWTITRMLLLRSMGTKSPRNGSTNYNHLTRGPAAPAKTKPEVIPLPSGSGKSSRRTRPCKSPAEDSGWSIFPVDETHEAGYKSDGNSYALDTCSFS